ncbi:ester cyclase [Altericista sp. CCNU0014]|uniref:ester cyclase n=1 Tax=Altericista sp. CCNU0014 TaxID=3082949 RepID=UPI00384A6705
MNAREIVEIFVEQLWNQRQLALADDLFPADFVAKPIAYQSLWQGTGPESMKHHVREWLAGLPDLQMNTIAMMVRDDRVWSRWEMTGTHEGTLYGIPPTGKTIKALGVTLFEIADNKIRSLETIFDGLGLMQQLDVLPDAATLIENYLIASQAR